MKPTSEKTGKESEHPKGPFLSLASAELLGQCLAIWS